MILSTCPSRETLLQYSVGMLDGQQRDALDDHLECCADCQATIMTLDDSEDTVVGRLRTPLSSESSLAEPELQDVLAAAVAMPVPRPSSQGSDSEGGSASDMPAMLGEYQLLEELGRGGMGRVYKALHTKLDRVVALKVLSRGRGGDRQAITRFDREMKAVGRLAHPNIVQAHDAREIDDTPVLIMEFVDGLDLAEIVRRVGPLPMADACELIRQTALALQCAHEHGLVHRDVKPSNIMLTPKGEVKLLDLGLARFYAEGATGVSPVLAGGTQLGATGVSPVSKGGDGVSSVSQGGTGVSPVSKGATGVPPVLANEEMTGAGQAMGTADYMAPEQASDSRTVDIRADLYSLGCTLYKLLSGRAPFSGPEYRTTLEKLNAHVHQPAPLIRRLVPEVPEGLAAILDRLLAKDPGERFATPAEVSEALAPWCAGADLPVLLKRAVETQSSPLPLGEGQGEGERSPEPLAASQRWKSRVMLAIALLLVGGLGFALGIVITIKKDGETYQLTVPASSQTTIDEKGNATVDVTGGPGSARPAADETPQIETYRIAGADPQTVLSVLTTMFTGTPNLRLTVDPKSNQLVAMATPAQHAGIRAILEKLLPPPGKSEAATSTAKKPERDQTLVVSPAVELKALQGTWNIVRVEKGDAADKAWGPFMENYLRVGKRFIFDGAALKIREAGQPGYSVYECSVGSNAVPRWIDLYQSVLNGAQPFALGVYEISGNRLKLCLAIKSFRSPRTGQRPEELAVEPSSGNVLLTLERYQPSADEEDIQGHWTVVTAVEDGETIPEYTGPEFQFSEYDVFNMRTVKQNSIAFMQGGYILDPGMQPKTITIHTTGDGSKSREIFGIYKFENDRLHFAYHQGGPRPEKFESTRGSGVMLLVLKRIGSAKFTRRAVAPTNPAIPTSGGSVPGAPKAGHSAPAAPPTVTVSRPVVREIADYEDFTGRIEAAQTVTVRARVTGRLDKVVFKPDSMVKQGDLLFEIDPAPFQAEHDKREADVRLAQLRLNRTTTELKDAPSPSPSDRRRMEAQQAEAEAALTAAQEGLKVARLNLASTRLTAPISGKIGRPLIPVGSLVADPMPLATIDSVDPMCVAFDVDQRTVLALHRHPPPGDGESVPPVLVQLADEKDFPRKGKVESADTRIDPATGTACWRALLPNPDGLLMPGMFVRVRLITSAPHKALLIPERAIRSDQDQKFVFVVNDRNVIENRAVKLGKLEDELLIVREGISADDWVVVSGLQGLRPGMTVKPEKTAEPPPKQPTASSAIDPAAELNALQGQWKVLRAVSGTADGYKGGMDVGTRLIFHGSFLDILAIDKKIDKNTVELSGYRIDPRASPKSIDLLRFDQGFFHDTGTLGVYEIDGDRLTICWAFSPSALKPQRPIRLEIEPGTAQVLLTLERYRLSEDEKTIEGDWEVLSQSVGGEPIAEEKYRGTQLTFYEQRVGVTRLPRSSVFSVNISGLFLMDSAEDPKRLTIKSGKRGQPDLLGIYRFEGDRLHIAYRFGGPRPKKFESEPGRDVTSLVLGKSKPAAAPQPDKPKAGESQAPPSPTKTPTTTDGKPTN